MGEKPPTISDPCPETCQISWSFSVPTTQDQVIKSMTGESILIQAATSLDTHSAWGLRTTARCNPFWLKSKLSPIPFEWELCFLLGAPFIGSHASPSLIYIFTSNLVHVAHSPFPPSPNFCIHQHPQKYSFAISCNKTVWAWVSNSTSSHYSQKISHSQEMS